jgi:hypothetical protein
MHYHIHTYACTLFFLTEKKNLIHNLLKKIKMSVDYKQYKQHLCLMYKNIY